MANSRKKVKVVKLAVVESRVGRKANPRQIEHNSLFKDQNVRLRVIADKEGTEMAIILRRIVDWYLDTKEAQESVYSKEEFEKLEPSKSNN